jgi:hypothetical protein
MVWPWAAMTCPVVSSGKMKTIHKTIHDLDILIILEPPFSMKFTPFLGIWHIGDTSQYSEQAPFPGYPSWQWLS